MTDNIIEIPGILEIDSKRGVIYFHNANTGMSALRICRLPVPIPDPTVTIGNMLDITHGHGVSWFRSNELAENESPEAQTEISELQLWIKSLDSDQLEKLLWSMSGLMHNAFEESGDPAFKQARDLMMETSAVIHNRGGN